MANFKVVADSEFIQIDDLRIAPAEADALKAAISFAGAMRDVPTLPPKINYNQFVVEFFEDGSLVVARESGQGGKIHFDFNTVDQLVVAVSNGLGMNLDRKRLSPSPRSVGDVGFNDHPDIIEGY